MQQQSNKQTGTCKLCKQKISISQVVQHAYICQQKKQPENLQKHNEENKNQVVQIESINNQQQQQNIYQEQNVLLQEQQKKQDQTNLKNEDIQQQQNTIQKEIQNNQDSDQKQCVFCQKTFYINEIEKHHDKCEYAVKLYQMQIEVNCQSETQNIEKREDEDEANDQSQIHESFIEDGMIRRTKIKKDLETGFTHFTTNYLRNSNGQQQMPIPKIQNKFLQNNDEFTVTKFEFKDHPNLSEEHKKCTICLSEYKLSEVLSVLPCLHRFHEKCIDIWINDQHQRNCPICKLDLEGF